jgi:ATP-dependent DNA helicase RecG
MTEGEGAAPAEAVVPLRELDRALAPLRRTLRYALSDGGREKVRYFGRLGLRHLAATDALDLPAALREPIDEMGAALRTFDDADRGVQDEVLSRLYGLVARIDALAGLPLHEVARPVRHSRPTPPPVPAPAAADVEEEEDDDVGDEDEDDDLVDTVTDGTRSLHDLVPDLAEALAAAGIVTARDLAGRPSVSTEVLDPVVPACRGLPSGRVALSGRLQGGWSVLRPDGTRERWSRLVGTASVPVRWAAVALGAGFRDKDVRAVVAGTSDGSALVDAELAVADGSTVRLPGWQIPGVDDRRLRAVWRPIAETVGRVRDPHAPELLRPLGLPTLGAALVAVHTSADPAARRRLGFEEVLLAQLGAALHRFGPGRDRGLTHHVLNGFAGRASSGLELTLDDAQQASFEEIKRDLRRPVPMRRVVTGEVGAGKGRIALLAAATVAESRSQVLVVAPDPVEAEQRLLHSEPLLKEGGFVARLVPSPPTKSHRDAIKRGEVHVVYGTADLLDAGLEFRRLGLVIAVERDPWGRASVRHAELPAPRPDLLVTPVVPVGARVLLTAYADHQVSVVVDAKRRPATITLCRAAERNTAYQRIRDAAERGDQSLVVFPMVDNVDAVEIPEAVRLVRALEGDALAGLRVGLLHGAMPREERTRVVEDFQHLRTQVLVCTTRFEDGPPLPGASVAVIEQADRVDQFRLHRLIGFLSRARSQAEAILVVGEMAEPDAAARIERVLAAPNGFHLTEALVTLRGVDAVVAPGSPPLPAFRWLDLDADRDLVLAAREEAHRIVRIDPGLRRGTNSLLARELRASWTRLWPNGDEQGWTCPVTEDPAVAPERRRRRRRRRRKA